MESVMSNTNAAITVTLSDWDNVLGDRLRKLWVEHPDWAMRSHRNDTIYCLPFKAIDCLARRDGNGRAFLDPAQAAAEREFTTLCEDFSAIGRHAEKFIISTPLNVRQQISALDSPVAGEKYAWIEKARSLIDNSRAKLDSVAEQMKGYTGWLLIEPEFLSDVDRLRALCLELPARLRPHLPMYRPGRAAQHPSLPVFDPEESGVPAQAFGDALVRLLDRWGLRFLATWDLPVPQGPLLPNLLPLNSPAQPRTGVNVHVPTFLAVHGSNDLAAEVFRMQMQAARDLGVDQSAVGLPRYEAYARVLDILHLERTIRSRFGSPTGPRGLVDRLVSATADCIGMKTDRIRKYRKAIPRCRRGERADVTILRVTPTARRRG